MRFLRVSTVLSVLAAVLSGALLFWISQSVQQTESQLRSLELAAQQEQKTIRVLRAEWDYLNRPDRLEVLAQDYLSLSPLAVQNVAETPEELPEPFLPAAPRRKPGFVMQPAVFKAGVAKPAPVVEKPSAEPVQRSFQSLLSEIGKEEDAP
ncbi:MAG: hypothetical protein H6868_04420 [Rhodospirillales bacterium]|nr:hypothetical protein [Rhodospirillales bacterium]